MRIKCKFLPCVWHGKAEQRIRHRRRRRRSCWGWGGWTFLPTNPTSSAATPSSTDRAIPATASNTLPADARRAAAAGSTGGSSSWRRGNRIRRVRRWRAAGRLPAWRRCASGTSVGWTGCLWWAK